ncbi:LIMR family protein Os06g0128200 [Camellia lanceoleosa]|uniref:LIMR family protein Os06g0128200 n=1 Tax=Camellia lanceoleosa TaxID=1840588 RepID=A0ACC0IB88_9ERIC|nr:LIMR family protein Os06g0128200 [Camellia lanceoleosa]
MCHLEFVFEFADIWRCGRCLSAIGTYFSFFRRPKSVITRSQYIKEATELGKKARELKKAADALRQEEKSGSKGRKWRKNVKAVEKVVAEALKSFSEMEFAALTPLK